MRALRFLPLLLALLLPAPALPVAPAASVALGAPPAAAAVAPGVLPEASPEATWRHATALAGRIGPRAVGEPGYLRAVEYMEAQLRGLGYQVRRQPFTVPRFEVREVALRVTAPEPLTLRPSVLQLSGSAPPEGVTAPLVEAGVGRPDELARAGARGKVVLVRRGPRAGVDPMTFREKVEHAAEAGALAVIVYNDEPGPIPAGTLGIPAALPAVTISGEEGDRLRALLARGPVVVHLRLQARVEEVTSWNVVGRRAGEGPATLVIGGHLDTVPQSPGANDNASGIAAALEAARLLAGVRLPLSVEIVGFGAEEVGLDGSRHYVQTARERLVGLVNMDMVGRGPLLLVETPGADRLRAVARRAAQRLGLPLQPFRPGGPYGSDHVPFEQAGIPTAFLHTGGDPAIHTPQDTVDRLDPERMAQAARLAAAIALDAGEPGR